MKTVQSFKMVIDHIVDEIANKNRVRWDDYFDFHTDVTIVFSNAGNIDNLIFIYYKDQYRYRNRNGNWTSNDFSVVENTQVKFDFPQTIQKGETVIDIKEFKTENGFPKYRMRKKPEKKIPDKQGIRDIIFRFFDEQFDYNLEDTYNEGSEKQI